MSQRLKSAESFQEHNPMEALEAGNKEDDTSKKKNRLKHLGRVYGRFSRIGNISILTRDLISLVS